MTDGKTEKETEEKSYFGSVRYPLCAAYGHEASGRNRIAPGACCADLYVLSVQGFANLRQYRLREAVRENTARYGKEGEGFLLDYMKKIGFKVEGNKVIAFVDDDGEPVPVSRAMKEGWADEKT